MHWKSAVPRNYKNNDIVGDPHQANKSSSDLEKEISIIKTKYLKASYPNGFIDSVINEFHQTREDFLIPPLFEQQKEISFQVPFCKRNEEKMNQIICKLEEYTNFEIKFTIPFLVERSNISQSKCYLGGNMYMQRVLYWRNKT